MMLHTERATRGQQRAFVHYGDLLEDWTQPVFALGEAFDLAAVKTAMAVDIAEVHRFIDPSLRRVTMTWDDIGVPARLRELADETWQALDAIAARAATPPSQERATSCGPPTPSSTPRPRRSHTRPSSPSGARPPRTRREREAGATGGTRQRRRPRAARRPRDGAERARAEAAQGDRPGTPPSRLA